MLRSVYPSRRANAQRDFVTVVLALQRAAHRVVQALRVFEQVLRDLRERPGVRAPIERERPDEAFVAAAAFGE
jgi:hypothetical protein